MHSEFATLVIRYCDDPSANAFSLVLHAFFLSMGGRARLIKRGESKHGVTTFAWRPG